MRVCVCVLGGRVVGRLVGGIGERGKLLEWELFIVFSFSSIHKCYI